MAQQNRDSGYITITYSQLNVKSHQLAHLLIEQGIVPDAIVGIMTERSVEMIIGIFGILKAGGAYLPIDSQYPKDRIDYMLKDSGTKVLVTTNTLAQEGEKVRRWEDEKNLEIIFLDSLSSSSPSPSILTSHLPNFLTSYPFNISYVIYTSGSTGRPKGVMIQHCSVVNFVKGMTDFIDFRLNDMILSLTTISFDIFALETIVPLICGSVVVMEAEGYHMDPAAAVRTMDREKVTIFQLTPSRLRLFLSYGQEEISSSFNRLRYLLVGGEAFPESMLEQSRMLVGGKIYNMYGPTETTIWSTVKELSGGEALNIGKPITNTRIYITNNAGKLQPVEIVGELCIGGDGLARGYLNNPELTFEKFINYKQILDKKNQLSDKEACSSSNVSCHSPVTSHHSLLYKTGDLARWLPDGNIEFLGRKDHQVKIRGFRIELREIESRLSNYPGLREVVVLVREEVRDDKYICAYFVSDSEYKISELRDYLSRDLPDYMIPSYFIGLEKIPLTPSGKVDQRALPRPELKVGESYTAPGDEIEKKLVEIWSEVLGIEEEKIGINDNFFHLGGNSLKATILAARVHREINVNMTLIEVFKTPSIIGLAQYIRNKEKSVFVLIKPIEKKEYYELSSSQKRLYVLQQMKAEAVAYNMPLALMSEGNIDKGKLEKAFRQLIKRHEAFRTSFASIDGTFVQIIHKDVNFHIEYEGMDSVCLHDETRIRRIIKEFIRSFSLDCAPLLRIMLIRLSGKEHLLLVDIHHIISDGMSLSITVKDFIDLYGEKELPLLRIQYKDFTEWQNILLESGALEAQEKYWLDIFNGPLPVLNLNPNSLRPPVQNFVGETTAFETDRGLTGKIKKMVSQTETTIYIMLFSVFNILLAKYTEQEDIIIGSPIAGRSRQDLDSTIGVFVNTIAMRNFPDGDKSFEVFLKEVKENVLEAFANQDYPFEKLVNKLNLPVDPSRNPLFDVVFAFNNIDNEELAVDDLKFYGYEFESKISRFDLVMHAAETNEGIQLKLEYATALFNQSSAKLILKHYVEILEQIIKDRSIDLKDIKICHDVLIPKTNTYNKEQLEFNF
ncbi:amino acid adenylation domain-containing protein [Acidobacteriota bacterium]